MIGIYKLVFEGLEDFPYVGRSIHIDLRLSQHYRSLEKGTTSNYKLQEAFEMSSYPKLEVLEECTIEQLSDREDYWITKLDAINNGLNITKGVGSSGSGFNHAKSKYSKEQITEAFFMLLDPLSKVSNISKATGITEAMLNTLLRGSTHLWLAEEYPVEFKYLLSLVGSRGKLKMAARDIQYLKDEIRLEPIAELNYPPIQDPEGNIYYIPYRGMAEFVRDRFPATAESLRKLLKGSPTTYSGKAKECKGWKRVL